MDDVIGLDSAAAEITARFPVWSASGLSPRLVIWRDEFASWRQRLESGRALVTDPDSIGVCIQGTGEWAELYLVVYRGGWADLDVLAGGEVITEGSRITSPAEFGRLVDSAVTRFLGTTGQSAS
ncbi:hypothetical protein ACFYWN_44125 [Streptomyces sp. NPDC002917]|uniref:hypothetical protein n=1 Tax=Streptomyces sp. NPDC002917 TaxID=3364671 RepID=UPI0036A299AD